MIGAGLAAIVSGLEGGCTDDPPEGRIVASWTLELGSQPVTCAEALLDRVRVTAIHAESGESSSSGAHPCGDGSAEVAVAGGTYLVSVDTLDTSDHTLDHAEKLVVAASTGETPTSLVVTTTYPTGLLHVRWTAPCPSDGSTARGQLVELKPVQF